jgi:hypothetical protein
MNGRRQQIRSVKKIEYVEKRSEVKIEFESDERRNTKIRIHIIAR